MVWKNNHKKVCRADWGPLLLRQCHIGKLQRVHCSIWYFSAREGHKWNTSQNYCLWCNAFFSTQTDTHKPSEDLILSNCLGSTYCGLNDKRYEQCGALCEAPSFDQLCTFPCCCRVGGGEGVRRGDELIYYSKRRVSEEGQQDSGKEGQDCGY